MFSPGLLDSSKYLELHIQCHVMEKPMVMANIYVRRTSDGFVRIRPSVTSRRADLTDPPDRISVRSPINEALIHLGGARAVSLITLPHIDEIGSIIGFIFERMLGRGTYLDCCQLLDQSELIATRRASAIASSGLSLIASGRSTRPCWRADSQQPKMSSVPRSAASPEMTGSVGLSIDSTA